LRNMIHKVPQASKWQKFSIFVIFERCQIYFGEMA